MNHRSATRIVELANAVRSTIDGQRQKSRSDAEKGVVRLFIVPSGGDKKAIENQIAGIMAEETVDTGWNDEAEYKSLILEHHMAASRFSFSNLYMPLKESAVFDTPLLDGSIAELSFLYKVISPLVNAFQSGNDFEISKILRQYSPMLGRKALAEHEDQSELLQGAESAVISLMELWGNNETPSCLEILTSVQNTGLFKLDNRVDDILLGYTEGESDKVTALRKALAASFDELESYAAYVTGHSQFATHQGIKGLEFPRVMVIMDDEEARGFLFSYEKLFGAKGKTETDLKNEREGRDTSIARTTRLFYVACTRAQTSLAVVAYTENVDAVKRTAAANDWFADNEIYIV